MVGREESPTPPELAGSTPLGPATRGMGHHRQVSLEQRLRATVEGEVGFDAGTRALYTMDASNYRRIPDGVLLPRTADDIVAAVEACREYGVPLVPRGGGTSVAGNATGTGLVIDTSRYLNQISAIDPRARTAVVAPGVVLDDLQAAAAPHGLRFGPDPSTHSRCTLGGMIGNNACGSHSVAWGTTADNVVSLEVLLADGTRFSTDAPPPGLDKSITALVEDNLKLIRERFFALPRRVSGYSLDRLLPEQGRNLAAALVGTEGTCVTILSATVKLVEAPKAPVLLVLGFDDDAAAADAVPEILTHGPLTVEGMNADLAALARTRPDLPEGKAWLFIELDSLDAAHALAAGPHRSVPHRIVPDRAEQRTMWRVREEGAGLATRMADGSEAWPGWEDAAVPPERLGAYLRDFHALLGRHELRGLTYGHFGEGCIHVRVDTDPVHDVPGFRAFIEEAADLVVGYGGSLSGEHGDGQARAEMLGKMYGPEVLGLFERFKDTFDPGGLMNPGMVVRPYRIDENLRFAALKPAPLTLLALHSDGGDLTRAARRCVGVGKCRNGRTGGAPSTTGGGVMCPSYQVTGEEKHSTRGRAHLLFEMLSGEVITDGWRSKEVAEALDLCLGCKACSSDCPVNVDMASYKAEFLHHHYEGRLRPAAHYSMGWLPLWAHLRLLRGTGLPGAAFFARRFGGVAAERTLPSAAREPFTRWFGNRRPPRRGGPYVVLWPDTFTNFLSPSVGRAAVEVLEAAGYGVIVPPKPVCCGLTWVSTGQLGIARRVLTRTLDVLEPALDAGLPVVGLEPSCTALFRTDLTELLPDDPRARRLADATRTFAETLEGWAPPAPVGKDALVQMHCHQHAGLGFGPDRELMARAGIAAEVPDSGCCGLAGNFGFEKGHYEVSKACGERVILPAVRSTPSESLVLADGFSCRTQIEQGTGRHALHLAEALRLAL